MTCRRGAKDSPSAWASGDNIKHERYYPPYFFRETRPKVTIAPNNVGYGVDFQIVIDATLVTSDHIHEVALIFPGAVTHGFNQSQRYIELEIISRPASNSLTVRMPSNGKIAPPGWYLLFVTRHPDTCEGNGEHHEECTRRTPSEGVWIRVTPIPLP